MFPEISFGLGRFFDCELSLGNFCKSKEKFEVKYFNKCKLNSGYK